jgi:carbon monoxide dehydrogenase subunit G
MSVRFEHSVHVDAAPAKVWDVLSDIERWGEWAPAVKSVERHDSGPLKVGSSATLDLKGAPKAKWTVTELTDGRSFTWVSDARVSASGWHVAEPDGEGTRLTLGIEAPGLLATLFWPMIMPVFRRNVRAEAEGLKKRCEAP